MNLKTANALEDFLRAVPMAVCRCSLQERNSGHLVECRYEELGAKTAVLIDALNTDETLVT